MSSQYTIQNVIVLVLRIQRLVKVVSKMSIFASTVFSYHVVSW